MTRRPASLGPFGKRQIFLCQGWDGTNPVVGTFDGHIYRYVTRASSNFIAGVKRPLVAAPRKYVSLSTYWFLTTLVGAVFATSKRFPLQIPFEHPHWSTDEHALCRHSVS